LDEEYGGPFYISVPTKMKVEDLRNVIRVRAAAAAKRRAAQQAAPSAPPR